MEITNSLVPGALRPHIARPFFMEQASQAGQRLDADMGLSTRGRKLD